VVVRGFDWLLFPPAPAGWWLLEVEFVVEIQGREEPVLGLCCVDFKDRKRVWFSQTISLEVGNFKIAKPAIVFVFYFLNYLEVILKSF